MIAQPPKPPSKPTQPIRLIALDLDGTLLRTDKTIGERTLKALHRAHEKGVHVVLASGRMTPAMEETASRLGLDVHLLSYNGAAVCAPRAEGRKRLFHQPLDANIALELIRFAKPRGFQVNFYQNDVVLSEDGPQLRPWIELYRTRTGSPFRFVANLEDVAGNAPTKVLFVVAPATRDRLYEEMRPRFAHRATVVGSDPEYLEFLDPQVDKGRSIARLAKWLNLEVSQVMALGDADNDITMLQAAGWGVAVANANERCRASANAVTASDHNHDAVAEAVERWVL